MPFTVRVRDPHARHVRAFDEATPEAAEATLEADHAVPMTYREPLTAAC